MEEDMLRKLKTLSSMVALAAAMFTG